MKKRRATFAILGPLPQALGYIGGPLALSRRARRHGWSEDRPGPLNLAGAIPIVVGAAFVGAAIVAHYRAAPDEAPVSLVPDYLVKGGVYSVTRNPMYVGGALMQAGWAAFFGSVPNAAALAVYVSGLNFAGIPFEERLLRRKFGASYDEYRRRVPRWIG